MLFSKSFFAVALLASNALATLTFNSVPNPVTAGTSVTLTYTATGSGPVTITLKQGPANNLGTVAVLTSSSTGGSYVWAVSTSLPAGTNYALQIDQAGQTTNYFGPFTLINNAVVASSAAASVASVAPVSAASSVAASVMPMASPSGVPVPISNGTIPGNGTATGGGATGAPKPTASIVSSNSAVALGSPLALVLGAVAAMIYLQ